MVRMVRANIDITDKTNKILNVIKACQGLNDKNEAIDFIAERYAELFFPDLIKD